jgi:hypothetical protein
MVSLDAVNSWTKGQVGPITALTDANPISLDLSLGNNFSLLMTSAVGATRQLANPTNIGAGQSGMITVTQSSGGSNALTYGSYYKFAYGTAPILSTGANAIDCLAYYVLSATQILVTMVPGVA